MLSYLGYSVPVPVPVKGKGKGRGIGKITSCILFTVYLICASQRFCNLVFLPMVSKGDHRYSEVSFTDKKSGKRAASTGGWLSYALVASPLRLLRHQRRLETNPPPSRSPVLPDCLPVMHLLTGTPCVLRRCIVAVPPPSLFTL